MAREVLRVLVDEGMIENAHAIGEYLMNGLREIESPYVKEVGGRGLLVAVDSTGGAWCTPLLRSAEGSRPAV